MKAYQLLSAALLAGALTACSSDDVTTAENKANWNADGTGYISLSINIPSTTDTRADNDNFNDGDKNEYEVKDAYLILFSGANESDATFEGAYSLGNLGMNLSSNTQITSTAKITQKINATTAGNTVYALVVVNSNGKIAVTDNTTADCTIKDIDGGDKTLTKGSTKFSDVQGYITAAQSGEAAASQFNKNGFFMTNAPLTSEGSSASATTINGSLSTLATINASNIYSTEAEANTHDPATSVYVERNLAKVTLKNSQTTRKVENATDVEYAVTGWVLDHTNNSSYLVRNLGSNWDTWKGYASSVVTTNTKYRFQAATAVENNLFRTYWALDPNYSDTQTGLSSATSVKTSVDAAQYCLENTLDVAHMAEAYTTRAIVEITYGGSSNTEDYVAYSYDTRTLMKKGDASTDGTFLKKVTTDVTAMPEASGKTNITVELSDADASTGKATLNVKVDGTADADLTAAANNLFPNIQVFAGGKAYYTVLLKHFGDELTPWDNGELGTGVHPTSGKEYGDTPNNNADKYLGRYGVLRNNWYQIDVQGVSAIGSPRIPSTPSTPDTPGTPGTPGDPTKPGNPNDDQISNYLRVQINILSWAVRANNVTLK